MLESMLTRRRGSAPGTRARTADELAALIDRAADLTLDEARERVATIEEGRRETIRSTRFSRAARGRRSTCPCTAARRNGASRSPKRSRASSPHSAPTR